MITLKELSNLNPSSYKVIDRQINKMEVKSWSDRIEIIFMGKSKFVTRRSAYKFGLAEKP